MTPSETPRITNYATGQLVQVQDMSAQLGAQGKYIDLGGIIANLKSGTTVHPTYVAPVASISSTQSQSGLEIGQTVSIPLTVAFTQNDGGTATGTSIKKDSTQISTANSFTDIGVVMSATPKIYQATVSYGQGAIKNNNFSEADANGRIGSGSVNSNSLSYRGYRKLFFGSSSTIPSTSADIRALSSQLETNTTVIIQTGITNRNFILDIPANYSIVSVIDSLTNANITDQFTPTTMNVNDAGSTPYSTKRYVMTTAIPYPQSSNLIITIA